MTDKAKIIMGIDPGTINLGYGLISVSNKSISLISMGVISLHKLGDIHK